MEPARLVCLMRTDLASLNPGKAMAQAMHAQALASQDMEGNRFPQMTEAWTAWKAEAGGFGTTIVLGGPWPHIQTAVDVATELGWPCGVSRDPTYPLMDGETLHLIPLDVCAWLFGPADWLRLVTTRLSLHP